MKQSLRIIGWIFWVFFYSVQLNAQENAVIRGEFLVMLEPGISPQIFSSQPPKIGSQSVRLKWVKTLVPRMNLHLFTCDTLSVNTDILLRTLSTHSAVALAQHNHRITRRGSLTTIPSDPGFLNQWSLNNTGQFGGTPDADIDATEAWDIATGAVTILGDSIVVAVVDGGAALTQEDLVLWKNKGEIPGNGADEDGNGYIDDYDGWNAFTDNGNIPADVHGTLVSGVVSARPNNAKGGVGVSWNTPIMPVAASSVSEAIVVAGYGYVLEMRTRYNQTNGSEGAFVVVANSSFGVNFGNPANFPIWCAMYDSLGKQGVLSVVSTMNTPQNVDVVGDVPSACSSAWMIAVTNTTPTDTKRSDAAFGLTTIDLGAPGTQIYSTLPGNNYGYDTGTSFAAPHVAGTLALMASYACPGLMILYKNDPATAALKLKDFLLQSVDTLSSLQGLVATGGRLNAYKALLMVQDSCSIFSNGCLPPFNLTALTLTDTAALLSWQQTDTVDQFAFRYRVVGDTSWSGPFFTPDTFFYLSGLAICTVYEFQVAAECDTLFSGYFDTEKFVTEGCCTPPDAPEVWVLGDSSAFFSWNPVFGADHYEFEIRRQSDSLSTVFPLVDSFLTLNDLLPCTVYEVRVKAVCDSSDNGFSTLIVFRTTGCGACLDEDYCLSRGNDVGFEWIQEVSLGPILNTSGKNDGYGNFTDHSFQIVIDSLYNLVLTPGYTGFAFSEAWRVWIDWDQNGAFNDTTERVFGTPVAQAGQVSFPLQIPSGVLPGTTRMRVSMKFGGFGGNQVPLPCELFNEGEVEDYCITLTENASSMCPVPAMLSVGFVPGTDSADITWSGSASHYEVRLKKLSGGAVTLFSASQPQIKLNLPGTCTGYQVQVRAVCADVTGSFSPAVTFYTKGCGNCRDLDYCGVSGPAVSNWWLRKVRIGDVQHISGADGGYGDYTQTEILLRRGDSVLFELVSGYSIAQVPQYWQIGLDVNQDGDFEDEGETIYTNPSPSDSAAGKIAIPVDISLGSTRLRVGMRADSLPEFCGVFPAGEWEDFCAEITHGVSIEPTLPSPEMTLFPNPTKGGVTMKTTEPVSGITLYNSLGAVLFQQKFSPTEYFEADFSFLSPGIYLIAADRRGQRVTRVLVKI
ncbi:MAG: GEVED domain-containing protein [Bacteroidia bacterium]|nr:GEVED domain-containing protein [Bacteroidia bacterium]